MVYMYYVGLYSFICITWGGGVGGYRVNNGRGNGNQILQRSSRPLEV